MHFDFPLLCQRSSHTGNWNLPLHRLKASPHHHLHDHCWLLFWSSTLESYANKYEHLCTLNTPWHRLIVDFDFIYLMIGGGGVYLVYVLPMNRVVGDAVPRCTREFHIFDKKITKWEPSRTLITTPYDPHHICGLWDWDALEVWWEENLILYCPRIWTKGRWCTYHTFWFCKSFNFSFWENDGHSL